jgi:hypothetical protein
MEVRCRITWCRRRCRFPGTPETGDSGDDGSVETGDDAGPMVDFFDEAAPFRLDDDVIQAVKRDHNCLSADMIE